MSVTPVPKDGATVVPSTESFAGAPGPGWTASPGMPTLVQGLETPEGDGAAGILTESAISFLGLGMRPPEASWGSLVSASRNPTHWWIQVFPGLLIFVTVTCYNLVGDAIRDALDPKMKV